MAGPLILDNYEIEADESTDELVITHVPTGKTTTLSEDTFETLTADELSVGGGATVTATVGDSGQYVPVETQRLPFQNYKTTSTSYEAVGAPDRRLTSSLGSNTPLKNTESDQYVKHIAHLDNDTAGETTTASIQIDGINFCELSYTRQSGDVATAGRVESAFENIGQQDGLDANPFAKVKVTGGTGEIVQSIAVSARKIK